MKYAKNTQTFAQRFIGCRNRKGWSQQQTAAEIGVSLRTVQTWEGATNYPTPDRLRNAAAIFGVSVAWLTGVDEAGDLKEDALPRRKNRMLSLVSDATLRNILTDLSAIHGDKEKEAVAEMPNVVEELSRRSAGRPSVATYPSTDGVTRTVRAAAVTSGPAALNKAIKESKG